MPGPRSFDQKQQFDFENLILRDLLVFAEAQGARVMHYRDDTGLEADALYVDKPLCNMVV